jgi:hypothetical protein
MKHGLEKYSLVWKAVAKLLAGIDVGGYCRLGAVGTD